MAYPQLSTLFIFWKSERLFLHQKAQNFPFFAFGARLKYFMVKIIEAKCTRPPFFNNHFYTLCQHGYNLLGWMRFFLTPASQSKLIRSFILNKNRSYSTVLLTEVKNNKFFVSLTSESLSTRVFHPHTATWLTHEECSCYPPTQPPNYSEPSDRRMHVALAPRVD